MASLTWTGLTGGVCSPVLNIHYRFPAPPGKLHFLEIVLNLHLALPSWVVCEIAPEFRAGVAGQAP